MTTVAEGRRSRGFLESDIRRVTDEFVTGSFTLGDGELLTPHRISQRIMKSDSLDKAPSTGAVANALKSWGEIGFAVVSEKPLAFLDYTEDGRNMGLAALKERASGVRKAERAAAKETVAVPTPEGVADQSPRPGHVELVTGEDGEPNDLTSGEFVDAAEYPVGDLDGVSERDETFGVEDSSTSTGSDNAGFEFERVERVDRFGW